MSEYDELMPCSLNEFRAWTKLDGQEAIDEFSKALNVYRLAVKAEREKRQQEEWARVNSELL